MQVSYKCPHRDALCTADSLGIDNFYANSVFEKAHLNTPDAQNKQTNKVPLTERQLLNSMQFVALNPGLYR